MSTTNHGLHPNRTSTASGTDWLTTQQAADYLCTRPKTLEYWRHTGLSPRFAKLGRQVRYRRDWLDEWLESRAATSTAESKRRGML